MFGTTYARKIKTSRYIGLDFGSRSIGVAVNEGKIAIGAGTIFRERENALRGVFRELELIYKKIEPVEIALGYPLNMDGTEGEACKKTRNFKLELEARFGVPVILWDERLSTVAVLRHAPRRATKSAIDEAAAIYILQGYLDFVLLKNI